MTAANVNRAVTRMIYSSRLHYRRCDVTSGRVPLRAVRLFLEMGGGHIRPGQVLRILNNARDREPLIPGRLVVAVEILGEDHVLAVRNAVLPEVPGARMARHHLQRPA